MMIVMKATATEEDIRSVAERIEGVGARADISQGAEVTVIGAVGDLEHDQRVAELGLETLESVDHVMPILKPYRLSAGRRGPRPPPRARTPAPPPVLDMGGRKIGGEHFALIAGPCTVESRDQTLEAARIVQAGGASLFRGGAYKPRTSPYSFQGLGQEGLRLLAEAKAESGLPVVTELMDVRDLDAVMEVADVVQLGARNMQNYTLLSEV